MTSYGEIILESIATDAVARPSALRPPPTPSSAVRRETSDASFALSAGSGSGLALEDAMTSARVPARAHARTRGLEDLRGGGKSTPRRPSLLCGIAVWFSYFKTGRASERRFGRFAETETRRYQINAEKAAERLSGFSLARINKPETAGVRPSSNRTVAASPYLATWCVRVPPALPSARRQRVLVATDDARGPSGRVCRPRLSAWRWTPGSRRAIPSAARRRGRPARREARGEDARRTRRRRLAARPRSSRRYTPSEMARGSRRPSPAVA